MWLGCGIETLATSCIEPDLNILFKIFRATSVKLIYPPLYANPRATLPAGVARLASGS